LRITSIFGLPAHIFFVHIPVVLVPLVAVGTVLIVWPPVRRRLGWILVVLAGVAVVATVLATRSGSALKRYVIRTSLVRQHTRIGGNLTIWVVLLFVLLAAEVVWDYFSGRSAGRVSPIVNRGILVTLGALSILVASVSVYWVYRIGHSGARASWSTVQHRIDTGQRVGESGRR
jgi:hypothetical protein